MDSTNFITKNLKELYSSLSYLEIRYEYRSNISTHIIEVKPTHCYEKDRSYVLKQIALEEEFEQMFPYEEILFMTENVLIQIENPILELGISKLGLAHTEYKSFDFDLTEMFGVISKVNISNAPYFYVQCSQSGTEPLKAEDSYKVVMSDSNYVCEPPSEYGKSKNNATKKDSEINQSLFFINIAS